MPDPTPLFDVIPTFDGKPQKYKAAGKLQDRKAIITGGDSGIGRATAILFAMEGADSLIAYLPEEEDDAQETKKRVEAYGRKCHLLSTDLRDRANCKKVVDEAVKAFWGRIDILSTTRPSRTWSTTSPTCPRNSGSTRSTPTSTRTFTWQSTPCRT